MHKRVGTSIRDGLPWQTASLTGTLFRRGARDVNSFGLAVIRGAGRCRSRTMAHRQGGGLSGARLFTSSAGNSSMQQVQNGGFLLSCDAQRLDSDLLAGLQRDEVRAFLIEIGQGQFARSIAQS